MPHLDKVKIKEVIVFSGDIDNKFEAGKNGVEEIRYHYDPDSESYSLKLYKTDSKNGKLCLFAVLHRADYIAFDPVEIAEENGATTAIQGDIETLREIAHRIGTIRIRDLLTNLEQECWERHGAHD